MRTLVIHPGMNRELKKLGKPVARKVYDDLVPLLLDNPQSGKPLTGEFVGVWRWRFFLHGVDYRLAYDFDPECLQLLAVGPRSGFYERLARRL